MAVAWDAEVLAPLFAVFGEDLQPLYTPVASQPGVAAFSIDGIFDRSYQELVQLEADAPSNTVRPVLGVRAAQFAAAPSQNDLVSVPSIGLLYLVADVQPDGKGHVKLVLNKVKQP